MRIAVVLKGGLHPSGEVEVIPAYLGLLASLARRHEVHAFALRHLPEACTYTLRGITVHDLGRPSGPRGLGRAAQYRALVRTMRQAGPFDVVHGIWGDPAGLLAAAAGRALGRPSLVTCDSGEFVAVPDAAYGLQRTARGHLTMALAARLATRLHVCTQYAATQARRLGYDPVVIPIGIDTSTFSRTAAVAEGPPWRLLQVASLNRVKHQALLVDTVARLARRVPVTLDLAGEDTLGGVLQARAHRTGVGGCVSFHGVLTQAALAPLYARAHLYVQTSWHEGAGVSVLEAASAGVPVVGTRAGYLADWAPGAAHAVDAPSPAALADAIESLLDDPARRAALAAGAMARVRAHDVEATSAAFTALYSELAGAHRSA